MIKEKNFSSIFNEKKKEAIIFFYKFMLFMIIFIIFNHFTLSFYSFFHFVNYYKLLLHSGNFNSFKLNY
jgi:hypothetical protein